MNNQRERWGGEEAASESEAPQLETVDVRKLLGPSEAVMIQHGARRYLLRLTKQKNLILTRDETACSSAAKQ